mgnify:FL=1
MNKGGRKMVDVLVKSLGFVFIIALGYILKKKGFFKAEDGLFFSKVVMNITLPAALIAGSSGMEISLVTITLIGLGFLANIVTAYMGKFLNHKKTPMQQALAMVNCSGYNVGNFSIPFAASFFDATGLMYLCMFDIGNAFMGLGGVYAIARNLVDGKGRLNIRSLCIALSKSIPFDVYLLLFVLSLFKITLPAPVTQIASMIGSANSFLAMLMIGIILEVHVTKQQAKAVGKILGIRYLGDLLLTVFVLLLPLPMLAKKMVIIILFSPLSTISAVYSKMLDENDPTPAIANSISIIVSIVVLTALLMVFA